MGKSEYNMEVGGREQFFFSGFKPALAGDLLTSGTMPVSAGMISDALSAAAVAALDVTAKIGGPALG
jgi:hypothetical protein